MRIVSLAGALLLGGLLWAHGAAAVTMTQPLSFEASNFTSTPSGHTAPVDPVVGSFTLQFDPGLDYVNSTDITVDSLNINIGGIGGPVKFDYDSASQLLQIHTGDSISVGGNTNSLWLALIFSPTPPVGPEFSYAQVGNSSAFTASNVNVTLTPIPGSVLMLLTGLTAIGAIAWARHRQSQPTLVPAAA